MLDTNIRDSPDAGYKLYHSAAISFPLLDSGNWSNFETGFQFSPPWQEQDMGDTFAVPLVYYLPENISFGYKVRSRALAFTFTLPDSLENSDTCPLFVWGRSGGAGNPTGWSFENYPNFETGWTKVTNGTGSDPDSLMDGIFAPSSKVIHLETAQYDVYGWVDSTGSYSHYYGHAPPDPAVAVNFSYFGRAKQAASIVQDSQNLGSDSLIVSVNSIGSMVNAKFFTIEDLPNVRVEFRDVLGRIVYSDQLSHTTYGWNEINLPSTYMASGAYFCIVTAENYFKAKAFLLLK
jgi:hypothetical protein